MTVQITGYAIFGAKRGSGERVSLGVDDGGFISPLPQRPPAALRAVHVTRKLSGDCDKLSIYMINTKTISPAIINKYIIYIFISMLLFVACGAQSVRAGETFRDCPECPEMVIIPAGSFLMGSSDADTARDLKSVPDDDATSAHRFFAREHPQHPVTFKKPFAMGKYPVTRGEFEIFAKDTKYSVNGVCGLAYKARQFQNPWENLGFEQSDQDPVACVSWEEANAYVQWLNRRLSKATTGGGNGPYRLPTEAEWEYAARAGTTTARWWGDSIGYGNANCSRCAAQRIGGSTVPAGRFKPNPFGLYDMLGNVREWVLDCFSEDYSNASENGSAFTIGNCDRRGIRGAGWWDPGWLARSTTRGGAASDLRTNFLGFRVVKE